MSKMSAEELLEKCFFGNYKFVQEYVDAHKAAEDYEVRDSDGFTPLHLATGSRSIECVRALLTVEGLDAKLKSNDEDTALTLAIRKDSPAEMLIVLLDYDIELVDILDRQAYSPLCLAVQRSRLDMVEAIVEASKRKNLLLKDHASASGFTTMMAAAMDQKFNILRYLVDNTNFDCRRACDQGFNVFVWCAMYSDARSNFDEKADILEYLLPRCYDMDDDEMPEEMLFAIVHTLFRSNQKTLTWFYNRFYLTHKNELKYSVENVLRVKSRDQSFKNYLIIYLHSSVRQVNFEARNMPTRYQSSWVSAMLLLLDLYVNQRHVFDDIIGHINAVVRTVPARIISTFFDNIFMRYRRDLPQNIDMLLEFLQTIDFMMELELTAFFVKVAVERGMPRVLDPLPILMAISVLPTADMPFSGVVPLMRLIQGELPPATEETIDKYCLRKCSKQPASLYELCRARVRKIVFANRSIHCNREKLAQLSLLDVPQEVSDYLRFMPTFY